MTGGGKEAAALALHRFGFGPARDSIAAIAADPRGAVLAELERPDAGRLEANLPSSSETARAIFEFRAEERAKQKLAQRAKKEAEAAGMSERASDAHPGMATAAAKPTKPSEPPLPQQLLQNEAEARYRAAVNAEIGFVERLVWFWSNHFAVSADKVGAAAGAYEREAIRPRVLGRFGDLLAAVEAHPAMLVYLDNVESIGPDSVDGINRDKGLNENLAREILELHTLGARAGYSQEDVTSFAKVLTGRSWIQPGEPKHGGEFVFIKRLHQPGAQIILGKTYAGAGNAQADVVLADLAHHSATAEHIAQKLARHFVTDEPPPSLVGKLSRRFRDTDGNLKEVARTLATANESWAPKRTKLKPPSHWIVAALRLTGAPWTVGRLFGAQATLGEALWRPPEPNGYPDTEAAWIGGLAHRLDIANEFAAHLQALDPSALLDAGLGPLASRDTRETIARAATRPQALALLLMTPEFLRS